MGHNYDLATHTYLDVKVLPNAVSSVVASTRENGLLAGSGVEFVGHVGELPNHLLYRIAKLGPDSDPQEDARTQHIVDTISALHGVVQVDVQTPQQRIKRDEL
ncbi:MAG: hypothetical protein BYD32DRAFT_427176 [Podila humilis]|nr:MAG: hypothetical protein BYD32DRAFT_427176 [Podila humilis]